jgi:O-antigen/teichoic acid export membrane protein
LLIGVPAAAGIACLAEPLVRVMLGEDWIAAVPLVEVLAIFALLRVFLGGTYEVLLALDKLHVMTLLSGIRLAILLPLLLWGVSSAGAYGAALALVGATAVRVLLNFVALSSILKLTIRELAASCWRTAISTGAMTIMLVLSQTLWVPGENVFEIAGQLLIFIGVGLASFILSYAALRVFPGTHAEIDYKLVSFLKERIADFKKIEGN